MGKYFPANNVYVYPSSNAKDGGADNSEENLAMLTAKLVTSNYVVRTEGVIASEDTALLLSIADDGSLVLETGSCVISGYYIHIERTIFTIEDLLSKDEDGNVKYPTNDTQYNIKISLHFDSSGHVRGDSGTATQSVDTCYGVSLRLADVNTQDPDNFPYLALGSIVITGISGGRSAEFSDLLMNPDRFTFINSDSIRTNTGVSLEKFLEASLRNLSCLNYWTQAEEAEDPENIPETTLYLEQGKILFRKSKNSPEENLYERLTFAEKGGYTLAGSIGKPTNTYNGNSNPITGVANPFYIARADHDHDLRYLRNSSAKGDSEQTIQQIWSLLVGDLRVTTVRDTSDSAIPIIDTTGNTIGNPFGVSKYNGRFKDLYVTGNSTVAGAQTVTGDFSCAGNIVGTNTSGMRSISGYRVYGAVWNDYAELYKRKDSEEIIEPGDIIAKVPGKDAYTKVNSSNKNLVVGVCSDSYGMLLGGESSKSEKENLINYIPVALAGRVYVKIPNIVITEGDILSIAEDGNITNEYNPGTVIGKALESSNKDKAKILIQVILG